MLIVTPQIDRRRDGLPSSSWGRGQEEGRKDGEGRGRGRRGGGEGRRGPSGSGYGRGKAGGGEGNPWMLLSFLSSCLSGLERMHSGLGGGSWAISIDIIILGFGKVAKI